MDKGGRSYRFNLRVEPAWMDRVRVAAERTGISMADYVIMVVNERLLGTEAAAASEQPAGSGKAKGKPRKDGTKRKDA